MRLVPFNGPANPFLEGDRRPPSQLFLDLREVDRVTPVMAWPVGNIPDQGTGFFKMVQYRQGNGKVGPLALSSDIVNFPFPPVEQNLQQGPAVILHIDPITNMHPVPIN